MAVTKALCQLDSRQTMHFILILLSVFIPAITLKGNAYFMRINLLLKFVILLHV